MRRLEKSKYAENLVLKGGLFLYSLTDFDSRVTVDVDFLLRKIPNTPEQLKGILGEIIAVQTGNDFVAPTINTYSIETTIAEKIDAILSLMEFSSRMKDYYDIYYLANKFDFDGTILSEALRNEGIVSEVETKAKVDESKTGKIKKITIKGTNRSLLNSSFQY